MPRTVAVIGGGPAGLMAAETIAAAGHRVALYDRMPTAGRKFLMAGRGGLNLTHSENLERFLTHYGPAAEVLQPAIENFPPVALREWAASLGQETFVGSSGRVFPEAMKASPLLRAWQVRLVNLGVSFRFNHRWIGWDDQENLIFATGDGALVVPKPDATVIALGGASWPKLGADGQWVEILRAQGIAISPLRPTNCGFVIPWSEHFRQRYAGHPLKNIALSHAGTVIKGEAMITAQGLEGGAVYALSATIRQSIERDGSAEIILDLLPHLSPSEIETRLARPRGRDSLSNYLRKATSLPPAALSLLRETATGQDRPLAQQLKNICLQTTAPFPLDRAISTAGGIPFSELDEHYMLRRLPGIFACGEMLDWEAPTGGYLLQATFATAVAAARGALGWLAANHPTPS